MLNDPINQQAARRLIVLRYKRNIENERKKTNILYSGAPKCCSSVKGLKAAVVCGFDVTSPWHLSPRAGMLMNCLYITFECTNGVLFSGRKL